MSVTMKLTGLYVGEAWRITFAPLGDPVNVTSWVLTFMVGTAPGLSDVLLATEANGKLVLTDAINGKGYAQFARAATSLITPTSTGSFDTTGKQYYYELWRMQTGNEKVVSDGVFEVKA